MGFIKYALAVANLSFNLSVLARSFTFSLVSFDEIMRRFEELFWTPIGKLLHAFNDLADWLLQRLAFKLFQFPDECISGFYLLGSFLSIVMATFLLYVVVQEDLLLKVQKVEDYLPFAVPAGFGALIVIPTYLSIKSCVLFIARNWQQFYRVLQKGPPETLKYFNLTTTATATYQSEDLAKASYSAGVVAIVCITVFLFVCLPLLLLDLYGWVPHTRPEEQAQLKQLARSRNRKDIKEAIRRNAALADWSDVRLVKSYKRYLRPVVSKPAKFILNRLAWIYGGYSFCCALVVTYVIDKPKLKGCYDWYEVWIKKPVLQLVHWPSFDRHYEHYMSLSFSELLAAYGVVRLGGMLFHVHFVLMFRPIGRGLGAFLSWRSSGDYMYRSKLI